MAPWGAEKASSESSDLKIGKPHEKIHCPVEKLGKVGKIP